MADKFNSKSNRGVESGMGNGQSVRSTHFQRPSTETEDELLTDDFPEEQHISISNKMVERLVEDATIGIIPTKTEPSHHCDYKDKINIEKLDCMDQKHSEKYELTAADVDALAKRIDARTNVVDTESVCGICKQRVLDCYNCATTEDLLQCWDTVGEFKQCVRDAAFSRLRARTAREAREHARRSRHVAHARVHALKDLGPKTADSPPV